MISFNKLDRLNGHEIKEGVQIADVQTAEKLVNDLFDKTANAWAFEKRLYGNGVIAFSLKDSGNKIIYQLKTLV